MNRNHVLLTALLFIVSFSAGVFTEILAVSERLPLAAVLASFPDSLLQAVRGDALVTGAALIFSGCVFLLPAVALLVMGKLFSLGFSAAYILSSGTGHALTILLAVLLPRALLKVPAYVALLAVSGYTARHVRACWLRPREFKAGLPRCLRGFLLCFLALALSSLLEACLLQGVL